MPELNHPVTEELARRLREKDTGAAPAVLNLIERDGDAADALQKALSPAQLGHEAPGHVVGVTGPPGAGKSTLLSELVREWRSRDQTVAVLAVDPSSKRSGGALLGDRARIAPAAGDRGFFMRSMAAAGRLGGLAAQTPVAAHLLAVAFDVVVIETVGVGQSETDVADVADTVAVIVQPGSGDVLQFMKSGVMEVPDLLVVTKSDLGAIADRTVRELKSAANVVMEEAPVIAVSSVAPTSGIAELADALAEHRSAIDASASRAAQRRATALLTFISEHGERGVRGVGGQRAAAELLHAQPPETDVPTLLSVLEDSR